MTADPVLAPEAEASGTGPARDVVFPPEGVIPQIVFRASLAALELVRVLREKPGPLRMLDIGGGHGIHADFFERHVPGLSVDIVDMERNDPRTVFVGDYLDFRAEEPYDAVWTSHVLEHVRNPGLFLDRVMEDLADGGVFACTVPPHRQDRGILAHLTTWDPMLLIINLVRAGFDARDGRFARYRYNVSGIVHRRDSRRELSDGARMPALPRLRHTYVADFRFWNWKTRRISQGALSQGPLPAFESPEAALAACRAGETGDAPFLQAGETETLRTVRYHDPARGLLMAVN